MTGDGSPAAGWWRTGNGEWYPPEMLPRDTPCAEAAFLPDDAHGSTSKCNERERRRCPRLLGISTCNLATVDDLR